MSSFQAEKKLKESRRAEVWMLCGELDGCMHCVTHTYTSDTLTANAIQPLIYLESPSLMTICMCMAGYVGGMWGAIWGEPLMISSMIGIPLLDNRGTPNRRQRSQGRQYGDRTRRRRRQGSFGTGHLGEQRQGVFSRCVRQCVSSSPPLSHSQTSRGYVCL